MQAVQLGIPVPCLSAALAYFDGYRTERLPANLLQAQRDYFGAHTYERVDQPRGEFFHTNWTGRGGTTTSRLVLGLTSPSPGRDTRPTQTVRRLSPDCSGP